MRAQEKANLVTTRREIVENMSSRPLQHNPNLLSPPKHISSDLISTSLAKPGGELI